MGAKFVLLELLLALSCCLYVEPSVFTEQFSQNTVELIPCKEQTATVSLYNSTLFTIMANLTLCTNFKEMDTVGFRVSTNIFPIESSSSKPVVFTARQSNSDGFVSWNAPLNYNLTSLPNVSHTMCSVKNFTDDNMPLFYVDAFTSSHDTITFTIEVELVQNFVLQTKKTYPIVVGHAAPQIYYYKIPSDVQLVTVETSSLELGCTIVSVQNNTCPVNDLLENVKSKGMYQTMMNSAFITINADSVPNRDFLLVLVTADYSLCYTNTTSNPDRVINIEIGHMDPLVHYRWAMALPIVVCIVVSLTSFLVCCFYAPRCVPGCIPMQRKCKCYCSCDWFNLPNKDNGSEQLVGNSEEERLIVGASVKYGTTSEGGQTSTEEQELSPSTHASEDKKDDQNVNDGKSKEDVLNKQNMGDGQSQGGQKDENNQKLYHVYSWNTVTVGIFYALPAIQLVYSEQLILDRGGDQDTCYYNFKCAHPVGSISAFNNIWSNSGYVVLGFVFIMIVMFRHFQYQIRRSKDKDIEKYGVEQFFGIYYAMGFALMLEGCMSALYHICPSNANFQFDTAFMFITGGIILVKVYQNRHPNVQANAFIAFFAFAVIILFTVIGIYQDIRHPISVKVAFFFITLAIVLIFLGQFYKWNLTKEGIPL